MSAMQQVASVAVQSNEERDSSHSRLVHSMTPDALLACGESPHTAAACYPTSILFLFVPWLEGCITLLLVDMWLQQS